MLHRAIDKAQLVMVELDLAGEKIQDPEVRRMLVTVQRRVLEQSRLITEARKELLRIGPRSKGFLADMLLQSRKDQANSARN